jgi:hypothetical protein
MPAATYVPALGPVRHDADAVKPAQAASSVAVVRDFIHPVQFDHFSYSECAEVYSYTALLPAILTSVGEKR